MEAWATVSVFVSTLALSIVAWAIRVESKLSFQKQQMDATERASEVRFRAVEDVTRSTSDEVRSQSNQLVELRTDVKYIREGIDALRAERRAR